jgi:hypothetical protein
MDVRVTRTRVSLATKLDEWAAANGHEYSASTVGGRLRYFIDGQALESDVLMEIMDGVPVGEALYG